jgi:hypothetical protein
MILLVAMGGLMVGWGGHALYRRLLIARHTRCYLCEGAGCINDITSSHGTPTRVE